MDATVHAYFEKSVMQYSRGDVLALLKQSHSLQCAGPLLAVTLNGIDNLGGICYSFDRNVIKVGERSIKVMTEKLGIPEGPAEFVYSAVRCGIVHQGMPAVGLYFFDDHIDLENAELFYHHPDGSICIDVRAFARLYLKTIERIDGEPEKHINFYPKYSEQEKKKYKKIFNDATKHITHNLQSYCDSYLAQCDAEAEERLKKGEIDHLPSSSAYNADMLTMMIELPPYEEDS